MTLPILTFATIVVGLAIDATFPTVAGHVVANVLVALAWIVAYRLVTPHERRSLVACVFLATAGEIFLCFVWGLYEYRHGNLPPFVPLGHSMIFLSGCRIAPHTPKNLWKWVVGITTPLVILLALTGVDSGGLLWFPLFLACLALPTTRPLYGVMFLLALAVEIAGTQVGSWAWSPNIPWFGLHSTNPPLCAGVFYSVLDVLVLTYENLRARLSGSTQASAETGKNS